MPSDCRETIYSEDYQDYLIEYYGDPDFINEQYEIDCYQLISNRFAAVYVPGADIESTVKNGVYIIPRCYGLLSSAEVLEATGVGKVQRQPVLSLYGSGVMIGFIDTGGGV